MKKEPLLQKYMKPLVSVVIPVKDEEENVLPLYGEINAVFDSGPWQWECIWVDDGSTDGTLSRIEELHSKDHRHRYISFSRNEGQSAALCAGFSESKGDIIATLDGDGQNDPADLPMLITMIQEGKCDMANGYRIKRRDGLVRRISSRIANSFRNFATGRTIRDVGCSTRAFRRECVENLPNFKGMHRFFPTLVKMKGFVIAESKVNHRPRYRGSSKYSIGNRLWVGLFDTFGIFWLQKRAFSYHIASRSESSDQRGNSSE